MILDAGVLVSVDRADLSSRLLVRSARTDGEELRTSEAVVAQVWRDGGRQARLARFLRAVAVHPLDDGRVVGRVLRDSATSDVVDAHLGWLADRHQEAILTGDVDDLSRVSTAFARPPTVIPWPPPARPRLRG